MRWKLKGKWLWQEYREPARQFFAVGGIFAAIGCIADAMHVVYGERGFGWVILAWGGFGVLIMCQVTQEAKSRAAALHNGVLPVSTRDI